MSKEWPADDNSTRLVALDGQRAPTDAERAIALRAALAPHFAEITRLMTEELRASGLRAMFQIMTDEPSRTVYSSPITVSRNY